MLGVSIRTGSYTITAALECLVRKLATRLRGLHPEVEQVKLTLRGPDRRHRTGNFEAQLLLYGPGGLMVVTGQRLPHPRAAIRSAFDAARNRLDHRDSARHPRTTETVVRPRAA